MVLNSERYEILKTASKCFLEEEKFGFVETDPTMDAVFGLDRSSRDAQIWKVYWSVLGAEEEKRKDGKTYHLVRELWRYPSVIQLIEIN
jgi:hypothetical protein